ncbi:DUF927 domain-containing protein [Escherichia coli]|nr:DUF927 domain-containing protein [Escherichia coli]
MEGIAARHNDGLLCLDEIAQVDASKAGEIAYMLPNGKGKQRSTKNGTAKEIQQWCLALLSNGEIDLKSHADSVRKSTYAGQEMRVINIPADNCEFACFDTIHERQTALCLLTVWTRQYEKITVQRLTHGLIT